MEKLRYRHGDVGLVAAKLPAAAIKTDRKVLAFGEVTGHCHAVIEEDVEGAEIYEFEGRSFLRVTKDGGISIDHQEHAKILVAPGDYEIRIAREYDEDEDFRRVLD